jgi:hypothetical protein
MIVIILAIQKETLYIKEISKFSLFFWVIIDCMLKYTFCLSLVSHFLVFDEVLQYLLRVTVRIRSFWKGCA